MALLLVLVAITILLGAIAPAYACAPIPPPSEAKLLKVINDYENSKDQIYPGDNFPRELRLAEAYFSLANLYNNSKAYKKSDLFASKSIKLVRTVKSKSGDDIHRYLAHQIGAMYLRRGDYENSAKYLDEALTSAKSAPEDKLTVPAILRTKADFFRAQKQWDQAERLLLKSIKLRKPYAYADQIALCEIYTRTGQFKKAKSVLKQAKSSRYKDGRWEKAQARLIQQKNK